MIGADGKNPDLEYVLKTVSGVMKNFVGISIPMKYFHTHEIPPPPQIYKITSVDND